METPMKSYHMANYYRSEDSNPRVFISPSKYIQGPGIIKYIGKYICSISPLKSERSCVLLLSQGGIRRFGEKLESSLKDCKISYSFFAIGSQCSWEQIDRVCTFVKEMKSCDYIVAIGGGKAVDLGKGVATTLDKACIVMPTLASNDAPTSSLSVIYDDVSDERQGAYFNYKNPDMVLVDTEIIANAPVRYLVAGMGDALATFIEARCASENPLGESSVRVRPTIAALAIGKTCTNTIMREAFEAISISFRLHCVEAHRVDEHLEAVVEANILLSGLGFENGGVSGGHALGVGITALPDKEKYFMHGEMVALGVLSELMLEEREEECKDTARFFTRIGLPICWNQLGIDVYEGNDVDVILNNCFDKFYAIKNMRVEKDKEVYRKGIQRADTICSVILQEEGQEMWKKLHST